MYIIDQTTKNSPVGMFRVEERIKNTNRPYLLENTRIGKYAPVAGWAPVDCFKDLALQVKIPTDKKIIVIGFAETATALGMAVAMQLHASHTLLYMSTTREQLVGEPLVEFSEEHSHAKQHYLYGDPALFASYDYVLFVEDEVTTGNTICNCIKALSSKFPQLQFGVAALLLCTDEESEQKLRAVGCRDLFYSYKGVIEGADRDVAVEYSTRVITAKMPDTRHLTDLKEYSIAFENLLTKLPDSLHQPTLFLGTEECQYAALLLSYTYSADYLTTTRVPVHTGRAHHRIASCYRDEMVHLYGMRKYDSVVVVTDGNYEPGIESMVADLHELFNARSIIVVRLEVE